MNLTATKISIFSIITIFSLGYFHEVYAQEITDVKLFIIPTTVSTTNPQVGYSGTVTGNFQALQQTCGQNGSIRWNLNDSGVSTPATGNIPVVNFSANSTQNITAGTFNVNTTGSRTSATYFFAISCANKILKNSDQTQVVITRPGAGGPLDNYNFNATPSSLTPGTTGTFNFSLSVTAKQNNVENKCGTSPILWKVYHYPIGSLTMGVSKTEVQFQSGSQGISPSEFGTGSTITRSGSGSITSPGKDFNLEAQLTCANGAQIGLSSPVKITSGGAGVGVPPPGGGLPPVGGGGTGGLSIPNPFGTGSLDTFQKLFDAIITFLYYLAGPVVVVMIIFAGLKFLFAKGEPSKITEAKNILWYAIVGLVIILIGRGFIALLESIIALGK